MTSPNPAQRNVWQNKQKAKKFTKYDQNRSLGNVKIYSDESDSEVPAVDKTSTRAGVWRNKQNLGRRSLQNVKSYSDESDDELPMLEPDPNQLPTQANVVVREETSGKRQTAVLATSNELAVQHNNHDKDEAVLEIEENSLCQNQTSSEELATQANTGYKTSDNLGPLHNLVLEYVAQGWYDVAAMLCEQTLEELEKTNGRDHSDVASVLTVMALIYRSQNKHEEAANLLNDAVMIREKTVGENHPTMVAAVNNLAVLYGEQGKYEIAEPLFERALKIQENTLGKAHPYIAKLHNNLALLCKKQTTFEYVESCYQQSMEMFEMKLDQDDPIVTETEHDLASCYLKQGKYKEAEILYKQFLTQVHERAFGTINDDNKPIWQVAEEREENKLKNGDWGKATEEDPLTVATALKNLGALYRIQGKYEAADTLEDCVLRSKPEALDSVEESTMETTTEGIADENRLFQMKVTDNSNTGTRQIRTM
ncbi:kinesin light chain-like [Sabethes cyaneus]|uniref:kinesin light chain-like n=1 Tax=Sabethes cyaneus TaxID=53552 RepID=UPI00237EA44C|nr:kinesin light chain-like [Sabethes cyaneus]